jgi:hypothetical protein
MPVGAANSGAEAQPLEGESGSLTASTVGATTELNEPRHDGSAGENTAGHSIWYRWTAPAAGTAIFTTEGSSFDTDLAAYTGSSVDSLTIRGWYEPDLNPWTTWSRLELRVEPGQVYSIVVDGQDGATGDVQLNWRMALDTGDTELPTVEMWSPEPGANVDGLVTFMADAYDNDSIDRVMYFIQPNGHTGLPWLVGEAREWPYAVELDTNVLEPGLYSVHARAVDASGNSASYGFDITVGGVPPPTLIVPENLTVEATRPTGALVRFNARATDFEGDPLPVTCNPRSGTIFPLGATTVTCSASDSFGNSTAKSFTVTVVDTTTADTDDADRAGRERGLTRRLAAGVHGDGDRPGRQGDRALMHADIRLNLRRRRHDGDVQRNGRLREHQHGELQRPCERRGRAARGLEGLR